MSLPIKLTSLKTTMKKYKNCWNLLEADYKWENGNKKIIFVRGEFWDKRSEQIFLQLVNTHIIIGISSYQNFPNLTQNPHDSRNTRILNQTFIKKYGHYVTAWFHCFRDPENYIPLNIPSFLYSESDFPDPNLILKQYAPGKKKYDFICSIGPGNWNAWIRRLDIALKWLNYMADEMNLKILVVGSAGHRGFSSKITCISFLHWPVFMKYLNMSKYLFNSSHFDASPRIITEAMYLDVPILLNNNILGGWKYINESTGMTFKPFEDDIHKTITTFMSKSFEPQKWCKEHLNNNKISTTIANSINTIFELKWSDYVDAFIYLNLDNRPDRKKMILHQLRLHDIPDEMIHRFPAIYNKDCGHLGCTQSHICILEYAKLKGWKRFVVLEDDFIWNTPKERSLYLFKQFIDYYKDNWDVFMLSPYILKLEPTEGKLRNSIFKVNRATTTAGYIVNQSFIEPLLDNFNEGEYKLRKYVKKTRIENPSSRITQVGCIALDQYWYLLQKTHRFYTSNPVLGKQSGVKSSIMAR